MTRHVQQNKTKQIEKQQQKQNWEKTERSRNKMAQAQREVKKIDENKRFKLLIRSQRGICRFLFAKRARDYRRKKKQHKARIKFNDKKQHTAYKRKEKTQPTTRIVPKSEIIATQNKTTTKSFSNRKIKDWEIRGYMK